jgi:hypothetical protein
MADGDAVRESLGGGGKQSGDGHPVRNGTHRVFADSKVHIPTAW